MTQLQPAHPSVSLPGIPLRRVLGGALATYAILVTFLAIRQLDYINADFVGYATIARRIFQRQGAENLITGCWSPLFSWCMVPFLALGVGDLVAGRWVLILGGTLYLLAAYGITSRFHGPDSRRNLLLTAGLLTCAVLQAAQWATAMLNPDMLAAGLLYLCLYLLLDPKLPSRPGRAMLTGLVAGLAYLAKAYMLPYLIVLIPLTLLLRRLFTPPIQISNLKSQISDPRSQIPHPPIQHSECGGDSIQHSIRTLILSLVGFALVASPWIVVLSTHYHRFTYSTAGSSNHANVSPDNFGNDPMWHQGLLRDFIADPYFAPDWSAFQDLPHLLHQARVFVYNARNAAGHSAPWLILPVGAAAYLWRAQRRRPRQSGPLLSAQDRLGICWGLLAAAVYAGGYCMVDIQARYFLAVIAPLLGLAGLLMILAVPAGHSPPAPMARTWYHSVPAAIVLVALFSSQDIFRMERIAVQHPQSVELRRYRTISGSLRAANLPPGPFAATNYHAGLYLAYAWDRLPSYLGAPLPDNAAEMMKQLQASEARIYLRWFNPQTTAAQLSPAEAFVPTAPWESVLTIRDITPRGVPMQVNAYVLPSVPALTSNHP